MSSSSALALDHFDRDGPAFRSRVLPLQQSNVNLGRQVTFISAAGPGLLRPLNPILEEAGSKRQSTTMESPDKQETDRTLAEPEALMAETKAEVIKKTIDLPLQKLAQLAEQAGQLSGRVEAAAASDLMQSAPFPKSPSPKLKSLKSFKKTQDQVIKKKAIDWQNQIYPEDDSGPVKLELPRNSKKLSRSISTARKGSSAAASPTGRHSTRGSSLQPRAGATTRHLLVEECEIPAVPVEETELVALPGHVMVLHTLNVPIREFQVRFQAARAQAAWRHWALSELSVIIFHDAFWWFCMHEFKAGQEQAKSLKAFCFNRIAKCYARLLMPEDSRQLYPNDSYLELYPVVLAQGILRVFQIAFPRSKVKFNESFYRRIVREVSTWTLATPRSREVHAVDHKDPSGRGHEGSEMSRDFTFDPTLSVAEMEKFHGAFLPTARDFYSTERHSVLVSHFLASHDPGAPETGGALQNEGQGANIRRSNSLHSAASAKGLQVPAEDPELASLLGSADGGALLQSRGAVNLRATKLAAERRAAAAKALVAAGVDPKEAVTLASFLESDNSTTDDPEELVHAPESGDGDGAELSYLTMAREPLKASKAAAQRYQQVKMETSYATRQTKDAMSELVTELQALWKRLNFKGLHEISNVLSHWTDQPKQDEEYREDKSNAGIFHGRQGSPRQGAGKWGPSGGSSGSKEQRNVREPDGNAACLDDDEDQPRPPSGRIKRVGRDSRDVLAHMAMTRSTTRDATTATRTRLRP